MDTNRFREDKLNEYAIKAKKLIDDGFELLEICQKLRIKYNTLKLVMKKFDNYREGVDIIQKEEDEYVNGLTIDDLLKYELSEPEPPASTPEVSEYEVSECEVSKPPAAEDTPVSIESFVISEEQNTVYPIRDLNFKYKIVQYKLSGISTSETAQILKMDEVEVLEILSYFNMI